jgi:hypothetical protein
MNATKIKQALNSCAFNPKTDPAMKIVMESGCTDYWIRRSIEELRNALPLTNACAGDKIDATIRLRLAIQLLSLSIVELETDLENSGIEID